MFGDNAFGQLAGVQCKLLTDDLTMALVSEEIAKAEGFNGLRLLIVATNARRDAKLQAAVRELSRVRSLEGRFPVALAFWDDLMQDLTSNAGMFQKHYPQWRLVGPTHVSRAARLISLIETAYYGAHFCQTMGLYFGEWASDDPLEFEYLCDLLAAAPLVAGETRTAELRSVARQLRDYVMPWVLEQQARPDGWAPANILATRIEHHVRLLQQELSGLDFVAHHTGLLLASWQHAFVSGQLQLSSASRRRLEEAMTRLAPEGILPPELAPLLDEYQEEDRASNSRIIDRVYGLAKELATRHDLRTAARES